MREKAKSLDLKGFNWLDSHKARSVCDCFALFKLFEYIRGNLIANLNVYMYIYIGNCLHVVIWSKYDISRTEYRVSHIHPLSKPFNLSLYEWFVFLSIKELLAYRTPVTIPCAWKRKIEKGRTAEANGERERGKLRDSTIRVGILCTWTYMKDEPAQWMREERGENGSSDRKRRARWMADNCAGWNLRRIYPSLAKTSPCSRFIPLADSVSASYSSLLNLSSAFSIVRVFER